jgi:hypothetical protein
MQADPTSTQPADSSLPARRAYLTPEDVREVPTIFTGYPRSGTAVLGDLANRYLDVAAVNEGTFEFWLADQNCDETLIQQEGFFDRLLTRLVRQPYFLYLYPERPPAAVIVKQLKNSIALRSMEGIAQGVLRLTAQRWGGKRLGHEDPLLINDLQKVYWVFPNCRIVHIVRDPRDVATSLLRFPWGANNVLVAARDWREKVRGARKIGQQLGPKRFLEIRYEDLLRQPRETMTSLMLFVCGELDHVRLEQFVSEMNANTRRNNIGNWRRKLTMQQVQWIEAVAQEQMLLSNYPAEMSPVTISAGTKLIWKLHHRLVQMKNIIAGKLHWDGSRKDIKGTGP